MGEYFKMNELYHYGIPKRSGRYPWGSGDRPFQSSGGAAGPKKKSNWRLKREQRAAAKEYKRQLEAAEEKRKHDADKARVLRSGSATEVMKYQGELTNKELQEVATRLDWESKIRGYSKKEIESAMDKMDSVMKNVGKINNWVNTATDSYNIMASIYNATAEGKKNPLSKINKGEGKKDKK